MEIGYAGRRNRLPHRLRTSRPATKSAGVAGSGPGLWVQADAAEDGSPSARSLELGRELRSVLTVLAERRNSRRLPELLRTITEPGALADGFGAWSDMAVERKLDHLAQAQVSLTREGLIESALAQNLIAPAEAALAHRAHAARRAAIAVDDFAPQDF